MSDVTDLSGSPGEEASIPAEVETPVNESPVDEENQVGETNDPVIDEPTMVYDLDPRLQRAIERVLSAQEELIICLMPRNGEDKYVSHLKEQAIVGVRAECRDALTMAVRETIMKIYEMKGE